MAPLDQLFSHVCGQSHSWSLGGDVLPFCQRCTGLYVGGVIAFLLFATFRPRATPAMLCLHGLLLLQMIPFGYHWVAQNGEVRTLTGQLFALGLVYYLTLNPAARWRVPSGARKLVALYLAGALVGIVGVQVAVHQGGALAFGVLSWLGVAGLVMFSALGIANLLVIAPALWRLLQSKLAT